MASLLPNALASLCLLALCSRGGPAVQASERSERTDASTTAVVQDTLQPLGTVIWVFRFQALTPASIVVRTTAPAEVACRFFDTAGRPLPAIEARGYQCRFAWLPAHTGAHRIEVRNAKDRAVPYEIRIR